jgi:hypothetical protein
MKQNKEYVKEEIGVREIEYFETVGLKLKNETMKNFLYRLRIEHQNGVGGFEGKVFY